MLTLADVGSQRVLASHASSPSSLAESQDSPPAAVSPFSRESYAAEEMESGRCFREDVFDKVRQMEEERQARLVRDHEAQLAERDAEIRRLREELQKATMSLTEASMAIADARSESTLLHSIFSDGYDDELGVALESIDLLDPIRNSTSLDVGSGTPTVPSSVTDLLPEAHPSMVSPFGRQPSFVHNTMTPPRSVSATGHPLASRPITSSASGKSSTAKRNERRRKRRDKEQMSPRVFHDSLHTHASPSLTLGGILAPVASMHVNAIPQNAEFGYFGL